MSDCPRGGGGKGDKGGKGGKYDYGGQGDEGGCGATAAASGEDQPELETAEGTGEGGAEVELRDALRLSVVWF